MGKDHPLVWSSTDWAAARERAILWNKRNAHLSKGQQEPYPVKESPHETLARWGQK